MYDTDEQVEQDVAVLRRKLKEESVDRQVRIRRNSTMPNPGEVASVWWTVSVPTKMPGNSNYIWFYLERSRGSDKGVHVKDPCNNMAVLATLPTVESAYFAGVIAIDRPTS